MPHSLIRPFTIIVLAPWSAASLIFIVGVSSGHKTIDSILAFEAYAASAAPAFPLVGIAIFWIPNSFALATAKANPLALKDPVGSLPSSFTNTSEFLENLLTFILIKGVINSPRSIIDFDEFIGSRGKYFQNPGQSACRFTKSLYE